MKRWVGLLVLAVVVAAAMVGTGRPGLAGTGPEPKVMEVQWVYAPGPGWPAGWTPPEAPKAMPQSFVDDWKWEKEIGADAPERLP